jgi:hypothetical protein
VRQTGTVTGFRWIGPLNNAGIGVAAVGRRRRRNIILPKVFDVQV